MIFIVIGIIGIALSGFLSNRYYNKANPSDRMMGSMKGLPLGGVVPPWISWINVLSFALLIYGIICLFRKHG